jgi:hypothetical protein
LSSGLCSIRFSALTPLSTQRMLLNLFQTETRVSDSGGKHPRDGVISNALVSPTLTARILAADALSSVTRLVLRALRMLLNLFQTETRVSDSGGKHPRDDAPRRSGTRGSLTARILAADALSSVTRLVLRALLDPQDPKMRSAPCPPSACC